VERLVHCVRQEGDMTRTIDVALEQKREDKAARRGVPPERAPGKETPDIRGPLGADEPGVDELEDELDGRGRD
jgi:hypothetical protein